MSFANAKKSNQNPRFQIIELDQNQSKATRRDTGAARFEQGGLEEPKFDQISQISGLCESKSKNKFHNVNPLEKYSRARREVLEERSRSRNHKIIDNLEMLKKIEKEVISTPIASKSTKNITSGAPGHTKQHSREISIGKSLKKLKDALKGPSNLIHSHLGYYSQKEHNQQNQAEIGSVGNYVSQKSQKSPVLGPRKRPNEVKSSKSSRKHAPKRRLVKDLPGFFETNNSAHYHKGGQVSAGRAQNGKKRKLPKRGKAAGVTTTVRPEVRKENDFRLGNVVQRVNVRQILKNTENQQIGENPNFEGVSLNKEGRDGSPESVRARKKREGGAGADVAKGEAYRAVLAQKYEKQKFGKISNRLGYLESGFVEKHRRNPGRGPNSGRDGQNGPNSKNLKIEEKKVSKKVKRGVGPKEYGGRHFNRHSCSEASFSSSKLTQNPKVAKKGENGQKRRKGPKNEKNEVAGRQRREGKPHTRKFSTESTRLEKIMNSRLGHFQSFGDAMNYSRGHKPTQSRHTSDQNRQKIAQNHQKCKKSKNEKLVKNQEKSNESTQKGSRNGSKSYKKSSLDLKKQEIEDFQKMIVVLPKHSKIKNQRNSDHVTMLGTARTNNLARKVDFRKSNHQKSRLHQIRNCGTIQPGNHTLASSGATAHPKNPIHLKDGSRKSLKIDQKNSKNIEEKTQKKPKNDPEQVSAHTKEQLHLSNAPKYHSENSHHQLSKSSYREVWPSGTVLTDHRAANDRLSLDIMQQPSLLEARRNLIRMNQSKKQKMVLAMTQSHLCEKTPTNAQTGAPGSFRKQAARSALDYRGSETRNLENLNEPKNRDFVDNRESIEIRDISGNAKTATGSSEKVRTEEKSKNSKKNYLKNFSKKKFLRKIETNIKASLNILDTIDYLKRNNRRKNPRKRR